MIIHCTVKENILVVIVDKLLVQEKFSNVILKIALKLMVNNGLSCLRKVNMLDSKIMKGK